MVAVVSGSSLGLFNSSSSTLGNRGEVGTPGEQHGPDRVYVNSSTGNLVIQSVDETLASIGLDLSLVRTYNSQGLLDDDNGDNWRVSVYKKIQGLTGTVNTAGSTVTKVFGDGAAIVYTWNASLSAYLSTDGDGAHDTLTWNASTSQWTWTDGSSRNTETYDSTGRLIASRDTDGNTTSYGYTGSLLTQITDASGQTTWLDYTGTNLTQIRVVSQGVTQTRTHYEYDAQNRLSKVIVDNTPGDNSVTDGDKFTTTYTYENTSKRVASIVHSDGTGLTFTYELVGGAYRLKTYSTSTSGATTANANTGALVTTESVTTTTNYNLNTSAATPQGWSAPTTVATVTQYESARVKMDSSGNAFAVWAQALNFNYSDNVMVSRFDVATQTWSTPVALDSGAGSIEDISFAMDAAGNTLVAWIQNDGLSSGSGLPNRLYARRYDASTQAWSAEQLLATSATGQDGSAVRAVINGGHAAIAYTFETDQGDGDDLTDQYVIRYDAGAWQTPFYFGNDAVNHFRLFEQRIAIDAAGNLLRTWPEMHDPTTFLYAQRLLAGSTTWSTPTLLAQFPTALAYATSALEMDSNGNAIWMWDQGDFPNQQLKSASYQISTDTWSSPQVLQTGSSTGYGMQEISMDANGDALATYMVGSAIYASIYDHVSRTWGSATQVSAAGATSPTSPKGAMNGAQRVITWLQTVSGTPTIMASRYVAGAWSTPVALTATSSWSPSLAIDSSGNVDLFYGGNAIFYRAESSYVIPAGATWQSLAQTLYGVNTAAAGAALQAFLANPPLTAGTRLRNLPAVLSVQTTVQNPVTPYYLVGSGDTWASITQAVYGTSDANAIAALQSALGTSTLTVGAHLVVPLSLSYTGTSLLATTLTYTVSGGTATITPNNSILSTTETSSSTTNYSLNTAPLVTPPGTGWGTPTLLGTGAAESVVYDAFGNAFVTYSRGSLQDYTVGFVCVRRYDKASGTWSPELTFRDHLTRGPWSPGVQTDANGNAILAWQEMRPGSLSPNDLLSYAVRYDVATATWGAVNAIDIPFDKSGGVRASAINGNNMVVVYPYGATGSGVGATSVAVSRWVSGAWTAPQVISSVPVTASNLSNFSARIDSAGNILVTWEASNTSRTILYNRFNAATGTWGTAATLATITLSGMVGSGVRMDTDASGNAFIAYRSGNDVLVRRYNASTNTWAAAVVIDSVSAGVYDVALDVDSAGNAIVGWVQNSSSHPSAWVNRYTASSGTWGTATLLETSTLDVDTTVDAMEVSISGSTAFATWAQLDASSVTNTYGARFASGAWSTPTLLESNTTDNATHPVLAMDAQGNATVVWTQANATYAERYAATSIPYYLVQSGDTWSSIAQLLYGTTTAAAQLQAAVGNPTLTAGVQLSPLPGNISVTTVTTTTVPPYYVVLATDTWSSIALTVYGTSDSVVVSALQAAMGNPSLVTGAHLTMPQSLTYTVPAGLSTHTDIQSPLGLVTTVLNDSLGRLTSVFSPDTGSGRIETRITYDSDGNLDAVIQDPNGLHRLTDFTYDSAGNPGYATDSNHTTYQAYLNGQLASDNIFLSSGVIATRYAYDSENHLRFKITPEGRVTEFRYNPAGKRVAMLVYTAGLYTVAPASLGETVTEAQLVTWAGTQDLTKIQRTDYAYDFRGNLSTETVYLTTDSSGVGQAAGASLTRYVYDQRGLLLQKYTPRGEATTGDATDYRTVYTYDGLGRLLTTTEWIDGTTSRTTITQYDDAHSRVTTTYANGRVVSSIFNAAGDLVSTTISATSGPALGTTLYAYDRDGRLRMVTDPLGQRTYALYDNAGRKSASIDADGTLTQYVYNFANQLVKTVVYSDRLTAATLATLVDAQGNPANVSVSTLVTSLASVSGRNPANDLISRLVYDTSGRVIYTIDPTGAVTQKFYDGADRVTDEVSFATQIIIAASVDEVAASSLTVPTSADDRHARYFFDNDGKLRGTLDAAGYLVEYRYGAAGQLIQQIAYANVTPAAQWTTGTLAQLIPATDTETATDYERDIVSYFFYDGEGRRTGVLDGEGYLTETQYDLDGNVSQVIRYDYQLTYATNDTVATLKSRVPGAAVRHQTSYQYDGLARVVQETNYEGTTTTYVYDADGHRIKSTLALTGTSSRVQTQKYDAYGRVTAELSPQGFSYITSGMSQAQIDLIWDQYSVKHAYDANGNRISTTDQFNNKTLFYYDADGRLAYTVSANGEVTELRYNALGQLTDTIAYTARISTAALAGGAVTPALLAAIALVADSSRDSKTSLTYRLSGKVATRVTTDGQSVTYTYNAFGEESQTVEQVDATRSLRHDYTYDQRGLLTLTKWDPLGINTSESRGYDAFGQLITVTDQRNNVWRTDHDRLGRVAQTFDGLGAKRSTTYDAFSRTLTTVDALNNTTSYVYDDVARNVVVTTPEGIAVTTTHTRDGQTLTVVAAGNTTTYGYDENGKLNSISDTLGSLESRTYDAAGRLDTSVDPLGTITKFTYDAQNRVLTRTVDYGAGHLNLTTVYEYDGQGRGFRVTEANGRITETEYDRSGRVTKTTINPAGLNIQTVFTYDVTGNLITMTEGVGPHQRRTLYTYDVLGRRTSAIVDPTSLGGTLNLTTQYFYDAAGNLTRTIDARLNSTWNVYDANNRLKYTVDALGGVTETVYDAENRITGTRRYATAVSTSGFGNVVASVSVGSSPTLDRFEQTVFDRDGRAVYEINAAGAVVERKFDANGHITQERVYAAPVAAATYTSVSQVVAALGTAGNNVNTIAAADHVRWSAYDVRGRQVFTVDGAGAVVRVDLDAAGEVTRRTEFATVRTSGATDLTTLQGWATANADSTKDRTTRYWYDLAGRSRFVLDAEGYLTETRYNDAAREVKELGYETKPSVTANTGITDLAAFVAVAPATRSTTTLSDVAGRVTRVTDFYGYFEQYGYDEVGNRTTFINKKNDTWTYEYDANGRQTRETAPPVALTTVTESGGQLTSSTSTVSLQTVMTYDELGNLRTRTEAANTSQARTTTYEYDVLGRQVRTIFPAVAIYNAAGDSATRVGTAVVRSDTAPIALDSVTAYDTLGNAYRNRDVGGGYAFKAYDSMGRVKYDVDALGYVTRHDYNAFGNETALVRYANPLTSALSTTSASITIADVESRLSASASADRTISQGYDRLGRLTSVTQPSTQVFETVAGTAGGSTVSASAVTVTEYNAFGDVARSRRLLSSGGTYADTYFYYDRRGHKTAEIDPLGYTTRYTYDATGNVLTKSEYAKALTPGSWNLTNSGTPVATVAWSNGLEVPGFDRVVEYTYDALNRKATESLHDFYSAYFDSFNILQRDTANTLSLFGYDAVGNQTQTTIQGATTYTWYDALGRSIAMAAPARNRGDGQTLIPLMEMKRDAFGNLVESIAYANSLASVSATVTPPTVAANAADRHTYSQFDALNHSIRTQDATGANRFSSYNARGDLMKEWQYVINRAVTDTGATPTTFVTDALVTIYEYDLLGRRTAVVDPQTLPNTGDPSAARVVRTQTTYNAFGEITGNVTSTNGTNEATSEYFDYDQAGHLWRTNTGDGVDKVYLYDVSGNVTAEIRHQTSDLRAQASASAANSLSGIMRTESVYDANGRLIEQRLPQFTLANSQDLIVSRPYISTMATPVPANAVYQAVTVFGSTYYVVNPVDYANGGGYYQVSPPTLANPQGTYARVAQASYQLVQAKQLHWPAPTQPNIVATFEYWPASNPGAVTTITPVPAVSQGDLGINVQSFAAGQYGYRISYKQVGSSTAFATQTGTFDAVNGTVTQTGTTSSALTVRPTTTQAFDRWGNVIAVSDASGNITQYRYNQLGQLTHTLLPATHVVDTRFSIEDTVKRADIENVYDVKGRLLQARDGIGNGATIAYNEVGQALTRVNASGATALLYDVFGDVIQETDALGYRMRKTYDKADRVLTMVSEINAGGFANANPADTSASDEAKVQRIAYGYDQAGRKITETNGEGEVLKYWYDLHDNVVRRRTALNFDTVLVYDAHGFQTSETDADGSVKSWSYDSFGRVLNHTELTNGNANYGSGGAAVSTFTYNKAGLATGQTSTLGQNLSMVYDEAGHLLTITENSVAAGGSGLANVSRVTQYVYDDAGRKVRDKVTVDGRVHQDTRIGYDELNRIRTLDDPDYHTAYTYDAAGNRSSIISDYRDHTGTSKHQELYYRYDQFNRVLISQGVKTTGGVPDIVVTGDQGTLIAYNARGERTSVFTRGTRFEELIFLTNGVESSRQLTEVTPTDHLAHEYYEYDGLGRLTAVKKESSSVTRETTTQNVVGGNFDPKTITTRGYDKASRVTSETNYSINTSFTNLIGRATTSTYDHDGRANAQTTYYGSTLESIVTFGSATLSGGVWSLGYDAASVLRGYSVAAYNNGTLAYTTTYRNQYRLGDSYQETQQTANSTGTNAPTPGSTTHSYNVDGELIQFTDTNAPERTRYFANDQSGQALTVIQGQFDGLSGRPTVSQAWDAAVAHTSNQPKTQNFFFADGHYAGEFGQLTDTNNAFVANFDVNYTPVSDAYPASAPSQVIAQHGDTLRIIAQRVFGDANLWYIIAQANGLATDQVPEGTVLTIPNDVISLTNTYSSFKPFDAERAVGDTTPTQPIPPPPKKGKSKKGCGVLGTILIIVVAIVVTIVTYGAAAPAMAGLLGSQLAGAMVAGAIAGAAGSIVSQGVGIAIGQQDSFNWKSVASAAIAGGIAPGIGAAVGTVMQGASVIAQQIATAAITNAAGQGVNIALGLQDKFSWSSVAASAVAAPVASRVEASVSNYVGNGVTGDFVGRLAGGAVQQVSSMAFNGGRVDYANLVADAFGNALGNSVSARVNPINIGLSADDYADMNAQIAAGMSNAQDEFDSLLRRDLAEQSMRLDLEAGAAQQIRITARDLNENLTAAIQDSARLPQFDFTVETVDPITAAEYAARGGRSVNFMADQSRALAEQPAPAAHRYGGGAATMRDNTSGGLGWQDIRFGIGAAGHAIADPLIDAGEGLLKIITDPYNSIAGRAAAKVVNEIDAWQAGGFTATDTYGTVRDAVRDRINYLSENPLRLIPSFDQAETGLRLGMAGASWWQGADTEQRIDAVGRGAGLIASLYTPEGIVGLTSLAAKGDALFNIYRATRIGSPELAAQALRGADVLEQAGGTGGLRYFRTEGLGTHASMAELLESGALPGQEGVILTDRTVRFGDVYELGTLGDRRVEFALTSEEVNGVRVKKLYSGDADSAAVPSNARLIGHVHPNEIPGQKFPSKADMRVVNQSFFRELDRNPNVKPAPSRIFWGPGDTDNTIFYPGFGKSPK